MRKLLIAKNKPILFDSSVLLVGVEMQVQDSNYSFGKMQEAYLDAVFKEFKHKYGESLAKTAKIIYHLKLG